MADIRCPMCGKINPAEADTCQYCQARLTPVLSGSPPPGSESFSLDTIFSGPAEDNTETDWLSSLRSDSTPPVEQPAPETAPEPKTAGPVPEANREEDEPEWLQRIRQRQTEEKTGPLISEQEGTPDWIKQIKDVPGGNEPDYTTQDDIPSPFPAQPGGSPLTTPAAPADDDDQEWMRKISEWQTLPDESLPIQPAEAPGVSLPDLSWLDQPISHAPGEAEPAAPSEAPGWLQDGSAEENTPEADFSSEDVPAWVKAASIKSQPAAGEAAPDDFPQESAAAGLNPADSEALPDWLNAATDNAVSADWTAPAAFLGDDAGPAASETNPPLTGKQGSWHDAFQESAASPEDSESGTAAPGLNPADSEALPDWLNVGADDAVPAVGENSVSESVKDFSWLDAFKDPEPARAENGLAGAALDTDEPASQQPSEPAAGTVSVPFSAKDLPDWLGESNFENPDLPKQSAAPAPAAEPASAMPFKENELDWLSTQPEDNQVVEQVKGEASASPDLQPAQMPGWLQAMRPVESGGVTAAAATAAMLEDDSHIETAGPLAGLRATLPGDSQAVQYHKPPIYSNTLHITDKQNVHATLLESLMSDSGRSHVSGKKVRKPSPMPRMVIGILMVVLVAAFLYLSGADPVPTAPPTMPVGSATLFANSIESLPQNSNVVFAVDYQPGYDGELRTASLALLQHLIEKKINIIMVSTLPSGPAIGEDLLLNQPYKEFKAVNLGYLPGGITSLQQFAVDPRSAAPAGYRESANALYVAGLIDNQIPQAWQTDYMKNIISIKENTTAIIVATDSIDVGRAWVEQVKPLVGEKPMLFIASAQAAPLLQPYLLSRQSAGMLTGLNDGLAYQAYLQQSVKGHPGITNAINMGVVYALLLVLVGAVMELISALLKQTRRKSKEVS